MPKLLQSTSNLEHNELALYLAGRVEPPDKHLVTLVLGRHSARKSGPKRQACEVVQAQGKLNSGLRWPKAVISQSYDLVSPVDKPLPALASCHSKA